MTNIVVFARSPDSADSLRSYGIPCEFTNRDIGMTKQSGCLSLEGKSRFIRPDADKYGTGAIGVS